MSESGGGSRAERPHAAAMIQYRTWMPRYVSPTTSSLRVLNLVPLYMKSPHVLQRTDMGSIMRTFMSLESLRLRLGSAAGSKSGGK